MDFWRAENKIDQERTESSAPFPSQTNRRPAGIATTGINLPKGGGAIRGIDEKFQVNAVNGNSSFTTPVPLSPSRRQSVPAISLTYNSGNGNSPFGLGWSLELPSIRRSTEKRLPQYEDDIESDTMVLSGAEDLVPLLEEPKQRLEHGIIYTVKGYIPRIEGLFARIECWKSTVTGETHWRTITKENVHSYFGETSESRLSDPCDATRVFEWYLCRSHDDKGSVILYRYKREDFAGVPDKASERNRIGHCTYLYIEKVFYGNKRPYFMGDELPTENDFLFEAVFDYGEYDATGPIVENIDIPKRDWACRKDPFSRYRSGFEVRTYRRCQRIMMFHCFDGTELPRSPYLVRSLELFYDDDPGCGSGVLNFEGPSLLKRVRQNGHQFDSALKRYSTKSLPDLDFSYQQPEWNSTPAAVSPESLIHSPIGIDNKQYLWTDLFSEGITGILTEQDGGLFYKSNLGFGDFSHAIPVSPKPILEGIVSGELSLQELEGDGCKYLVRNVDDPRGFFKIKPDNEWESYRSFSSFPNLDMSNRNMRLIDLTGSGRADLLVSYEDRFSWYPSSGEKGFEVSRDITKAIDEEKGPAMIFADEEQSIFLADMSGDGLTDIVRVRNGEICYWPNQGYGRFGSKVTMDQAPWLDHPDRFNPAYIRLADIDGTGTTDIIYLWKNEFRVWMNLNGNSWTSTPQMIASIPQVGGLSDISILDFLGSGTACLVTSSGSSSKADCSMHYIDLMGSKKPYLLSGYRNNCGKEITLEYKSSSSYYLEDKKEGRPWITKLPFPVHCISRIRVEDKIRGTLLTSSFRYSHGYFDHIEKEFRGFAKVEQLDTEDFSRFRLNSARNVVEEDLHQPPVRSVTWYHTGAFQEGNKILHQCKSEYFQNDQFIECELPEPRVSNSLTLDELREAVRAFKGLPLRTEVYADDNSVLAKHPYTATQTIYEVRLLQAKQDNRHASFLVVPTESVTYGYERNPADPRVVQSFVLETDEYGNIKQSVSIAYPRPSHPVLADAIPDKVREEQSKMRIVCHQNLYTDDAKNDEVYRLRCGYESKSYQISKTTPPVKFFLQRDEIADLVKSAIEISFKEDFTTEQQRRLSSHGRVYFLEDDLSHAKPLGKLSALGIVHKSYQLAFTKSLVPKFYGAKLTDAMLAAAGYVHLEGDEDWWIPTGTAIYDANPRNNFYTPIGSRDVFGNETRVEYDGHTLLLKATTDAIGNKTSAINDYRTLSPVMVTDPNLNRAAIAADELGLVVKSAVMGKEGADEGDTLADPTIRIEYDLFNWQNNQKPNFVHTAVREKHGRLNPRWQEMFTYSDGCGRAIMTKVQAEPGKAAKWNPITRSLVEVDANPRWVGNGRTIFNNKGLPIKQFEPYFSSTHEYEQENELVEQGVTPIIFYDPIGRGVKTEFPNGTFSKIQFDSWSISSFDANDTVRESRWYAERGSPDPTGSEPADPEQRAAWLAAQHHGTPGISLTDSLGRSFYAIADHGGGKKTSTYTESDPNGRYAKVFDQLGRMVAESYTNLLGTAIYGKTAEKGERWIFVDALGRPVRIWDNDIREFSCSFDKLHRPVSAIVKEGGNETLFGHTVYGEILPDAAERNLRGRAYRLYDQAGSVTLRQVDFKGNVTRVERKLTGTYDCTINWNVLKELTSITDIEREAATILNGESFESSTTLDALNRPIAVALPDDSIIEPKYNEANYLDSLRVKIRGEGDFVTFLANQDYDAKGQRQFAEYGNGLVTNYFYDAKTFRLVNLITKRSGTADSQSLQNLHYTFDPVGNIVQATDDAQQTHYFRNAVVRPESKFTYDAIYQLMRASGREHAGLGGNVQRDQSDLPYLAQLPHENDLSAVRSYAEHYTYDDCGNVLQMRHVADGGNWTRRYKYAYQDDPADKTNRLKSTSLPGDLDSGPYSAGYQHDSHGNMTKMPHLDELTWNFMDQLKEVNLGGGGKAHHVYGMGGRRIRKVIERAGGKRIDRIYLGAIEIYREYQGTDKKLERSTLHISDNTGRIAQVDTKLLDTDNADLANPLDKNLIRYQYANHLGSAVMETDEVGTVISYEEYHPYGTSAYRSAKSDVDLSLKRYRFSGKERDDETGLYYFGARYYAAWLGRWTSSDPAGFVDGLNVHRYCRNSPLLFNDPNGLEPRYLPGTKEDRLTPNSTQEEREAFASRRDMVVIDPHPKQQRWVGTPEGGHWELSPEGKFKKKSSEGTDLEKNVAGSGTSSPPLDTSADAASQKPPSSDQVDQGKTDADKIRETAGTVSSYVSSEAASAGAVRKLDILKKANLGSFVRSLLKNESVLDNIQRISKFASEQRQALRAADQQLGGILSRAFSRLKDANSSKNWGQFLSEALGGGKGEEVLRNAYTQVARNASEGNLKSNVLGAWSRILGGTLGGIGMVLSGYALHDNLSHGRWAQSFVDTTSFLGSGLAFGGALAGSIALTDAGLVFGSFGVGYLIGTGIDKGTQWASQRAFGVDLSPSNIMSSVMTSADSFLTPLWADPSRPEYTQTLGWKMADWFGL